MSVSSFYSTDRAEEQTRLLKDILKELRRIATAQENIARKLGQPLSKEEA